MTEQEMVNYALEMRKRAYAPYSKFYVGAALVCEDGSVYGGCNIENAAFGAGTCGERAALCVAITDGKRKFTHLAITGNGKEYCYPCGICRQMLYEFAPDLIVLDANEFGEYKKHTLRELLPYGFGGFEAAEK